MSTRRNAEHTKGYAEVPVGPNPVRILDAKGKLVRVIPPAELAKRRRPKQTTPALGKRGPEYPLVKPSKRSMPDHHPQRARRGTTMREEDL